VTLTGERNLGGADRITLKAVMDRMIPPVEELPGAGSLGLVEQLETMAGRVPGLRFALASTLDALSLDPRARAAGGFLALEGAAQDEAIRAVESALPAPFGAFLEMVYAACYSDRRVHERIGWPPGGEMCREPFDDSVLDLVRRREPFWRRIE